jgi:hypothetical protein
LLPLLAVLYLPTALAAPPKAHTVVLGPVRKVPYTPPEATAEDRSEEATTLKVRPLSVDGAMKEWTVGEFHDITDRTFVIRRALRINDALPGEAVRWSWQPGPWLSVDRVTGHITALHLPDFDPQVSEAVWFRDYAAYCGLHVLVKSTTLTGIVFQLGSRRAAVSQKLANWPLNPIPRPVCAASTWQRGPIRATLRPTGLAAVTFDLLGTTSLVEDADEVPEGQRD